MPPWDWLEATDGSYNTRAELRECRTRSRYDAALLVARLVIAQEFGAAGVVEDQVLGSPLWFHRSGTEGAFYLIEDGRQGTKFVIVWAGSLRRIGFGEVCRIAERRLASLEPGSATIG